LINIPKQFTVFKCAGDAVAVMKDACEDDYDNIDVELERKRSLLDLNSTLISLGQTPVKTGQLWAVPTSSKKYKGRKGQTCHTNIEEKNSGIITSNFV